jgi:uncharacterized protein RhaS with RHS repeats
LRKIKYLYDAIKSNDFMSLDPLAHRYLGWNPYNYVLNNPVRLIDPDGMAPEDIIIRGTRNEQKAIFDNLGKLTNDKLSFSERDGKVIILPSEKSP